MNTVWVVFCKEMLDAFRDRRMMRTNFLILPLAIPLIFGLLSSVATKQQREKIESALPLPVIGANHAPNLVTWLRGQNVEIQEAPKDIDSAIQLQDVDLVLRIPKEFPQQWRASEPAQVELSFDSSRPQQSGSAIARIQSLLAVYSQQVGSLRLIARGVHPAVMAPLVVSQRDLALPTANPVLAFFAAYLLLMYGFMGGMHLAIDATAGERERQSLEPLLANPVSRAAVMSGKILATAAFAIASLVVTLICYKYGFQIFAEAGQAAALIKTDFKLIMQLFFVVLPVILFAAVVITALAAQAKSYREAGSYVSLLMFIPMIPAFAANMLALKQTLWMFAIPIFAQNQMIIRLVRGETLSVLEWLTGMTCGVLMVLFTWLIAAQLYQREHLAISG